MALINILNLTFSYDNSSNLVFDNVSFQIDSNWRIGFIGRNGKGKTTFLKLLMQEYEYQGKIVTSLNFNYFPFAIEDDTLNTYEIAQKLVPTYQQWEFDKELNILEISDECKSRPFNTLSGGEKTKVMLAMLFLHDNNFLLIDEPTNHLDGNSRQIVSNYLNSKKGFILVSHDREFLDGCINHVLAINKTNIEIQNGNFTSWFINKERQDNLQITQNEKLIDEIDRLTIAAKQKSNWSNAAEEKRRC